MTNWFSTLIILSSGSLTLPYEDNHLNNAKIPKLLLVILNFKTSSRWRTSTKRSKSCSSSTPSSASSGLRVRARSSKSSGIGWLRPEQRQIGTQYWKRSEVNWWRHCMVKISQTLTLEWKWFPTFSYSRTAVKKNANSAPPTKVQNVCSSIKLSDVQLFVSQVLWPTLEQWPEIFLGGGVQLDVYGKNCKSLFFLIEAMLRKRTRLTSRWWWPRQPREEVGPCRWGQTQG